jgi:hypothetical protein
MQIAAIIYFALTAIAIVNSVGKDRKPVTAGSAAVSVSILMLLSLLVILYG